jgi:hypothetical protein
MKKIILFSAVVCTIALFHACKKDSSSTKPPTTEELADTIDPVALSATIKVGHGTSITGEMPATTAGGPTLLTEGYDNRTYEAISNRYIVIYPQSDKGYVAGYYVKINGANSYFKVDFSTASGLRKAGKHHGLREEGDNSDSSIVIKLPAGLKADTFSIRYAAYDSLNRVSNTLTAIVSLVATDSSDNSLLAGTWRLNRVKENDGEWEHIDEHAADSSNQYYACTDGHPEPGCSGEFCKNIAYEFYGETLSDIIFSTGNKYSEHIIRVDQVLNTALSTCSDLVYSNGGLDTTFAGGYSYNPSTKMLIIIYDDGSDGGGSNVSASRYTVSELSATKIVYYGKYMDQYDGTITFYYSEFLKK